VEQGQVGEAAHRIQPLNHRDLIEGKVCRGRVCVGGGGHITR
jgi:hypothetical protein